MAHLHRCACGRLFRCEGVDHAQPAWYWCNFQCPDRIFHGFGLVEHMLAQQFQLAEKAIRRPVFIDLSFTWAPATRRRSLRCQAQEPQPQRGSS
jgi:hypothetical protein